MCSYPRRSPETLCEFEIVWVETTQVTQSRQLGAPNGEHPALARSRGEEVPSEIPRRPQGGSAGAGGGALAIGGSFLAILGAGSEDAEAADAADFCGGALGEVVNIGGVVP